MKTHSSKKIPFVFLCLELFLVVFSIHISAIEKGVFTLRNIAIVVAVVLYFFYNKRIKSQDSINTAWICINIFYVIFSLFLCVINSSPIFDSHSSFRSFVAFFIMVVFFPFIFCGIETDVKRVAKAFVIVCFIQSVIVILSFLFPSVKEILYSLQSFDENWLYYRTVGLGIAGAGGSVYLFCGILVNCYYMVFYKKTIFNYLALFTNLFAIILVGRTGFYIAVIIIFVSAVIDIRKKRINFAPFLKFVVSILLVLLVVYWVNTRIELKYDLLLSSFRRLKELWEGDTIQYIAEMETPKLTFLTFFVGTGAEKGNTFDGSLIWNDSGYVQRYMSLGLVPSIFFYLTFATFLYWHIKRLKDKQKKFFWITACLLLFVIEYKEAFIFALAYPFILIEFLKLENNEAECDIHERSYKYCLPKRF